MLNGNCVTKEEVVKMIQGKLFQATSKTAHDSTTVLFGGLHNLTFDEAQEWLMNKIKEKDLEDPS